jgi:hypothetical protein
LAISSCKASFSSSMIIAFNMALGFTLLID